MWRDRVFILLRPGVVDEVIGHSCADQRSVRDHALETKHRQGRQDKRNRERENTTNRKEGRDKLPLLTPRVTISACSGETSTFTRRDFDYRGCP